MEYKKLVKSLHQKKYRYENQLFLVEGEKSVLELLHSSWQTEMLFFTDKFFEKNEKILHNKTIKLQQRIKESDLQQISTLKNIDSALAVVKIPENKAFRIENEYVLALADINDPGNLGTIIRIADWYGIKKIICSENTVDWYNSKTISASMASFLRVSPFYTDLKLFLQNNQLPVYGAFLEGKNIYETTFSPKNGIIVMGNESNGIGNELEAYIPNKIHIPRFGQAESLNVGIATAVICDNWKRQFFKTT